MQSWMQSFSPKRALDAPGADRKSVKRWQDEAAVRFQEPHKQVEQHAAVVKAANRLLKAQNKEPEPGRPEQTGRKTETRQ